MKKIDKIVTILCLLLPIMSTYNSFISWLDLASLILIILFFYCFLIEKRTLRINKKILILWFTYILYITVITLFTINSYRYNSVDDALIRLLKQLLYILIMLYFVFGHFFNIKYAVPIYKKICLICALFLLFQSLMYYVAHVNIPGYISNFITLNSYGDRIDNQIIGLFRPTSFFYEPSHFFEYVIMSIPVSLFENKKNIKNSILYSLLISLSIILSTSSIGIICTAGLWGLWLILYLRNIDIKNGNNTLIYILTFLFFIISIVLFINSKIGQDIITRTFSTTTNSINAIEARWEGYYFYEKLNKFNKIFGVGYANLPDVFFGSWAFNLSSIGVIGCLIILNIYFLSFKKANHKSIKVIVLLNLMISLFVMSFSTKSLFFFFIIILSDATNKSHY